MSKYKVKYGPSALTGRSISYTFETNYLIVAKLFAFWIVLTNPDYCSYTVKHVEQSKKQKPKPKSEYVEYDGRR